MYEVDFTGITRTPEYLKQIKENKIYRFKQNLRRLFYVIKYRRFYALKDQIIWTMLNRSN